ncbi:MAG: InlB B-repeat-containing protein [Treponema sp.]|jgi:hypothetical protein|nr:InlB B-repeat-containing protein [Treponema sp.]
MKDKIKLTGIIISITVIMFLTTACDSFKNADWTFTGDHIPLTVGGGWTENYINSGDDIWYSFTTYSSSSLFLWTNDSNNGDDTKSAKIRVRIYYSPINNEEKKFIDDSVSGSNSSGNPEMDSYYRKYYLSNNNTSTSYIRVTATRSGSFAIGISSSAVTPDGKVAVFFNINRGSGTAPSPQWVSQGDSITLPGESGFSRSGYTFGGWRYSQHYSEIYNAGDSYEVNSIHTLYAVWIPNLPPASPIPLTNAEWKDGEITASVTEIWYSFTVTEGTDYYVWWNSAYRGVGLRKTLYASVTAWYENGDQIFVSWWDDGWDSPCQFTATSNGMVYVRVEPNYDNYSPPYTGTFAIVYSTSNTRPQVPFPPSTALTNGQWTDGDITASVGERWYSFPVTAGATYHVWWNDDTWSSPDGKNWTREGDGKKTIGVTVSAYSSDWISVFESEEVSHTGWTTPQSFTADSNGTVYVKVQRHPWEENPRTGTFAIAYSTTSTRPK